jgi:hypothetical protein
MRKGLLPGPSVEREAWRSGAMERGRLHDGFAGMEGEAGRFP